MVLRRPALRNLLSGHQALRRNPIELRSHGASKERPSISKAPARPQCHLPADVGHMEHRAASEMNGPRSR